jgi:hypothetical protein
MMRGTFANIRIKNADDAWHRRRRHALRADRRGDADLRCGDALQGIGTRRWS